jgi:hypothetical protein
MKTCQLSTVAVKAITFENQSRIIAADAAQRAEAAAACASAQWQHAHSREVTRSDAAAQLTAGSASWDQY